ncbi:MAG: aldehyde dehydrogenase [Anaerolineaceae bacterium]|nr:aldehyde dehydrogenase [Anaerolineaceae bacterium]
MADERLRAGKIQAASNEETQSEYGTFGVLVDGQWRTTHDPIEVRSPYDQSVVAIIHHAGPDLVEQAIQAAVRAFQTTRKLPSWKRADVLEKISAGIQANHEKFSRAIALEAGKPIRTARGEVDRAIFTFKVAAEEAKRIYGEIIPLDWLPGNEGRVGHVHRVALGPIAGITPFNFPLNLVAHKVAPAIAAGNPILLRPDSQTPISALLLGELVIEAGWPAGGIAIIPTRIPDASPLVEDDRIKLLSFTGSPAVGWKLKSQAGMKAVALELGGNAGTIIHHDADIEYAAGRVAWGAFSYAGQSCISVQRVYIHQQCYEDFVEQLIPKVEALQVGNPLDDATDIGPVIDTGAADRIESWLQEALNEGAHILSGGQREGNLWQPTVLSEINEDMKVACQEIFGPVVSLFPYTDAGNAIRAVDSSSFGLQAGLFTNDMQLVNEAFHELEVGGLMVNDISTYRIDHMPYGGVKRSGFGREGLRYAIEEMTEMKLLTYNHSQ